MISFIVVQGSSYAVMNGGGRTGLTGEEFPQTVIDVVPGIIGWGGNNDHQDEGHHQCEANARQMSSIKAHCKQFIVLFSIGR